MLRTFKISTFVFLGFFAFLVAYSQVVSISAGEPSIPSEIQEINENPATAKPVTFDQQEVEQYRVLAAAVGMDYDRTYGYQEWADHKRKNEIGSAGNYEMLNFSTEGDPDDQQAMYASMREPHHWESFYFSNHDLTMLYVIKPTGNGRSSVKILKIETGRVPDIHQ